MHLLIYLSSPTFVWSALLYSTAQHSSKNQNFCWNIKQHMFRCCAEKFEATSQYFSVLFFVDKGRLQSTTRCPSVGLPQRRRWRRRRNQHEETRRNMDTCCIPCHLYIYYFTLLPIFMYNAPETMYAHNQILTANLKLKIYHCPPFKLDSVSTTRPDDTSSTALRVVPVLVWNFFFLNKHVLCSQCGKRMDVNYLHLMRPVHLNAQSARVADISL